MTMSVSYRHLLSIMLASSLAACAGGTEPQADLAPDPTTGTMPSHYQTTWELPAPSKAYVSAVLTPTAWLAIPGQDSAVIGNGGSFELSVPDGDSMMVTHGDAAPPGIEAAPAVTLTADESATIILFVPDGAVQEIDVAIGDWPAEPAWPDLTRHLAGTAVQNGDLYALTLDAAGPLDNQLLLATVHFSHETAGGTVSFFWQINPGAESLARQALAAFLDDLRTGRYSSAVDSYGGSYETLVDANTDVDPQDWSALLENACTINGFQCLRPMSIAPQSSSPDAYGFLVEFEEEDGALFTMGPCCGADETTPPQSEFTFTVVPDGAGRFLVQQLPPYLP